MLRFTSYSHHRAESLIRHKQGGQLWRELLEVYGHLPLPRWPLKSDANPKLEILQPLIRRYLEITLDEIYGWTGQFDVTGSARHRINFFRDFHGLKICKQIQFGNWACRASDFEKFRIAHARGLLDVAVCVMMKETAAVRMDSGVVTYERAVADLKEFGPAVYPFPILLIGIEDSPSRPSPDISEWGYPNVKTVTGKKEDDSKDDVARSLWADYAFPEIVKFKKSLR